MSDILWHITTCGCNSVSELPVMQDNKRVPASEGKGLNMIAGQHNSTGRPRDRRSLHLVGSCVKHEEKK